MTRFRLSTSLALAAFATTALCIPANALISVDDQTTSRVTTAGVVEVTDVEQEQHFVDLAICLDTSGSMDGLIEAAKIKLWDIVNELATAEPTPVIRVALLTYGNDGHNAENGWVRVDLELTEDLDMVSEQLFALSTNGGTELVGRVLNSAVTELEWHPSDDALKLIVVAGNESADQDRSFAFRDMATAAIHEGIMVNSIYCGNPADDIAPGWNEISKLADGHFATIDQNNGTVVIATPFDDDLATLSSAVNETYIAYGSNGAWNASNQARQDSNAVGLNSAAAASRAVSKSSGIYKCSSWDLVDACALADFSLAEVTEEDLPEFMKEMTLEEREAYIAEQGKKRQEIQAQIQTINVQRQAYIDAEMKKHSLDESNSFDAAIRSAIREQAGQKGFQFAAPAVQPDISLAPEAQPAIVVTAAPQPAQTVNAAPMPRQQLRPAQGVVQQGAQQVIVQQQQQGIQYGQQQSIEQIVLEVTEQLEQAQQVESQVEIETEAAEATEAGTETEVEVEVESETETESEVEEASGGTETGTETSGG